MPELKPKFKNSEKVKLISGSPTMTIEKIEYELDYSSGELTKFTGYYTCVWFDENQKPQREKFHENALESNE